MSIPFKPAASGALTPLSVALSLALFTFGGNVMAQNSEDQIALVGTWTSVPDAPAAEKPAQPSEGLYRLKLNRDGTLTPLDVVKMKSPSWLVKSADGRFLYTTNEEKAGSVTALSVAADGTVKVINTITSHGDEPTHATLSPDGRYLLVANYSGNKGGAGIAVLPVNQDGSLGAPVQHFPFAEGSGVVDERQESGHAHSVTFTPDGKTLYAADLGGDKLYAYRYDAHSATPLQPDPARDMTFSPGAGPRHMVFSADGHYAWVIAEMAAVVETWRFTGEKPERIASTDIAPDNATADQRSGGAIMLSPQGKFLIVSNRGSHNHLLVFRIGRDGKPEAPVRYPAGGIEPRALSFDATGRYLYVTNVFTNAISLFSFDEESGELEAKGKAAEIATPTDIKFVTTERP
jgi:6-phosphogluconolactonase (cycloisomerase 2 family)